MPILQVPERITSPQQPEVLPINNFAGLNISSAPTEIAFNESPDLENITFDDRGNLNKRPGYQRVFENAIDETNPITSLHSFTTSAGDVKYLLTHNTQVYEWFLNGNAPTSIHTGIANANAKWFNFNELAYLINGSEFLQYDGTDFQNVDPFIPTIRRGDTAIDEVNLLTGLFKQDFAGNGSTRVFTLALEDLDSTEVVAEVDGTTLTENTDFTVTRSNGRVEFNTAPSDAGGTFNITITASKTNTGFLERVTKNTQFIFHGRNNNVLYMLGNPDFPNRIIFSDIARPNYFPENNFTDLGSNSTRVTGFGRQYDVLLVFKEPNIQDATIFSIDTTGAVTPINEAVGCISNESIQIIENTPYILSDKGIYGLSNTEIRDERNVVHISDNIDTNINPAGINGLLDRGDLENYISVDYDRKYILSNTSTGIAWIYDYRYLNQNNPGQWLLWSNIYANNYIEIDSELYFGDSRKGVIFKFNEGPANLNDDDVAIMGRYVTKVITFGDYTRYKLVNRIFLVTTPGISEQVVLNIRTNRNAGFFNIDTYSTTLFSYSLLNYERFAYNAGTFPSTYRAKVKQKKINVLQIEFRNNTIDCNLGITNCTIQYVIHGENKGR